MNPLPHCQAGRDCDQSAARRQDLKQQPSSSAVLRAFALAPILPAALIGTFFAFSYNIETAMGRIGAVVLYTAISAVFGFAFLAFAGLPVFFLVRKVLPYRAWTIVPLGIFVGTLPSIPLGLWPFGFIAGLIGGVVFWLVTWIDMRRRS